MAQGTIAISGKAAVVAALVGEIVVAKGNVLTGERETTQVQSNQYDLLATDYTYMKGWNQLKPMATPRGRGTLIGEG